MFVYLVRMRTLLAASLLTAALTAADAPSISVLASGAVEGSIVSLKDLLPPATSQFLTSQGIAERLAAGDTPDVLIAQSAIVEDLIKRGKADAASRTPLGRIGIGAAVAARDPAPDLASVDGLKAAVLRAATVVVSRGASGAVVENIFRDLGIASQVEGKLRREARGDDVMKRIAESGGGAIGFTMISELRFGERHQGARYVAPLPQSVQKYTAYDAVVLGDSRAPADARAFVRALATAGARRVLADNGWVP